MAVPEQTPFIEYTANGTTTNFTLTFDCDNSAYLIVTLNGADAPVGSWSLVGTSVVFTTAPLNGVVVAIKRDTPLERTTNYQLYDNSFLPTAVNKDFDRIWRKLQELGYADWLLNNKIDQEILDRIASDEEILDYILNQDNTLKADYIARDAALKDYIDQMIALVTGDPSFTGITAAFVIDESGKTQQELNNSRKYFYSVRDFGAKPTNTAAQNDIAFAIAIAFMNAEFDDVEDGFLKNTPPKGILIVPADGTYEISSPFSITGNYSFLMQGTVKYTGASGVTVFNVGRQIAFDSISDNDYVLNMFTSVANVDAFELKNMVDNRITTMKIRGFKEALRCLARGGRGFFGNTFKLGTFDSNIIDIHIRSETNGAPNANRFYDGFFYKQRNLEVEQNCVKISSDGVYNDIDSNLFDGLNFEEGKALLPGTVDCIPINLLAGVQNRFINIRTENNSNTALARVNKRGNTIQTRAAFTTSTEVISSNIQHTVVIPQDEMQRVFTSGDLAKESMKLQTSGRIYNQKITFNDANVLNSNSTVSTAAVTAFDLTSGGIKFLTSRAMLSFKLKTNGDRRFLLRTFVENTQKRLSIAVACYDSSSNRLVNDPAIATGTWGVQQRIKSNDNFPLSYTANAPWGATGAYQTPTSEFATRVAFEVHPSVAFIEVYYIWGAAASDNDVTISRCDLYSVEGNASVVDAAAPTPTTGDRWLYQAGRGYLTFNLSRSVPCNPISLTNGQSDTQNFTFVGVELGDVLTAAFNQPLQGISLDAWVTSTDNISVKFTNNTGATIDLALGTVNLLSRRIIT